MLVLYHCFYFLNLGSNFVSSLPPHVLMYSPYSPFRALSDLNKDGKMDQQEFSIAMKLIKLKLQGQQLPVVLPPIMKQPPMFSPLISARFGMYAFIYQLYLLLSLILWGSGKDLLAQNDNYQTFKLSFIPLKEEILIVLP